MARGDFLWGLQFLWRPIWSMSPLPIRTTRRDLSRGCMFRAKSFVRQATIMLVLAAAVFNVVPAFGDDGFPFGFEMTLDAGRQPGLKRLPPPGRGDRGGGG